MKKDNETPKTNPLTGIIDKATDIGKKVVSKVHKSAVAMSDKNKSDSYARKLKKYNPLFPEQYQSKDFNIPNMIIIVDDAVRRGVDVCEGAIGWLNNDSGMEILYLYDEAIEMSGIEFVPTATCDAVYYVDNYNRNRFLRTDCIFSKAHEERLAELEHIAYSLGAKSCAIEIVEESSESLQSKKSLKATDASIDASSKSINSRSRSGKITSYFTGSDKPTRPTLKWFSKDETIKGLIEMRLSNTNSIRNKVLELEGASSATMSRKTAGSIDAAMGKNNSFSMETQAAKEHNSKLIYEIEF